MKRISSHLLTAALALTVAGGAGGWVASLNGAGAATPNQLGLVPMNPTRVLDTRNTGKLGLNGIVDVNSGVGSGVSAVAVNITLTDTEQGGYVTAWDGTGAVPKASIINSYGPAQTVANYTVVPTTPDGHFKLYTSAPANLIVDVMGYYPAAPGSTFTGSATATISGYAPASTITSITGTVTNGFNATKNLRVDVRCPNGTVETSSQYGMPAGSTKGFSVLCGGGAFTSGASIQAVVEV